MERKEIRSKVPKLEETRSSCRAKRVPHATVEYLKSKNMMRWTIRIQPPKDQQRLDAKSCGAGNKSGKKKSKNGGQGLTTPHTRPRSLGSHTPLPLSPPPIDPNLESAPILSGSKCTPSEPLSHRRSRRVISAGSAGLRLRGREAEASAPQPLSVSSLSLCAPTQVTNFHSPHIH